VKDDCRLAGWVAAGLPVEAVAVADVEEAVLVGLDLGKQPHRRNLTIWNPRLYRGNGRALATPSVSGTGHPGSRFSWTAVTLSDKASSRLTTRTA